jgi:5-methylcytosine-specific restriction endonuclease McrA
VKEVWCKAAGTFTLDLLHPTLREVVEEIYNMETDKTRGKTKDWLYGPITTIYDIFKDELTPAQRQLVAVWYDINNDIEALCSCDPTKVPATYSDVKAINDKLAEHLKDFCQDLFTDVIHLDAVTSRIGKIDGHYRGFVKVNKAGKCPYCGYNGIKGLNHSRREAYDHFLPKSVYPFNSVNFRNLAPMCHDCNSSYKLKLDPTRHIDPIRRKNTNARRKAFYSYSANPPAISLAVTLKINDVENLTRNHIDLQIISSGCNQEVESWSEVFGIEERYKAKFCDENDGKAWLQHVIEESANYKRSVDDLLAEIERAAERKPFDSANFLKWPFLKACKDAGVLR